METMSVDLGEAVIRSIDWSRFRISTGDAEGFGDTLLRLLRAGTPDESREVWQKIENFVFAQDAIFSAAEPTVDVIMAAMVDDRPRHVLITLIDLLFLILNGRSDEEPGLDERCHGRALRGAWLLAREAAYAEEPIRDALLEAMELIDSAHAEALRAWLAPRAS
jgi:hypothetical protein